MPTFAQGIPMEHGLLLSAALFAVGLGGVMLRRDMLFVLMSLEIMMNAVGLAFITGGSRWAEADGQVMFILVLTLAACEACIALALVIQVYRRFHTLDVDAPSQLKG